jgi:hypothetical protein
VFIARCNGPYPRRSATQVPQVIGDRRHPIDMTVAWFFRIDDGLIYPKWRTGLGHGLTADDRTDRYLAGESEYLSSMRSKIFENVSLARETAPKSEPYSRPMRPGAWLFVRGEESIRIVRPPGCALIIHGPDRTRQRRDFDDEDTLQAFQVSIAERLTEHGWILFGVDVDRRSGKDRRRIARDSLDRRGS